MVWIIIPATVNSVRLVHVSEDIYESNLKMGTRARKVRLMRLFMNSENNRILIPSRARAFSSLQIQQLNFFNK